jgi:predicted anti-sigma-YlaC factor YlaD
MSTTCEKALYLMMLSLNEEIEATDKPFLDSHLAECPSCRKNGANAANSWSAGWFTGSGAGHPTDADPVLRYAQ